MWIGLKWRSDMGNILRKFLIIPLAILSFLLIAPFVALLQSHVAWSWQLYLVDTQKSMWQTTLVCYKIKSIFYKMVVIISCISYSNTNNGNHFNKIKKKGLKHLLSQRQSRHLTIINLATHRNTHSDPVTGRTWKVDNVFTICTIFQQIVHKRQKMEN